MERLSLHRGKKRKRGRPRFEEPEQPEQEASPPRLEARTGGCPKCHARTRVLRTWEARSIQFPTQRITLRRRVCQGCGWVYQTREVVVTG